MNKFLAAIICVQIKGYHLAGYKGMWIRITSQNAI